MKFLAKWIKPAEDMGDVVPVFRRKFSLKGKVKQAVLYITAMGVYEAELNGKRVGRFVMAPGWTAYESRLQYQAYDVTKMLEQENEVWVLVGKGWYRSRISNEEDYPVHAPWRKLPAGLFAQLEIRYEDGSEEWILSDETWKTAESPVRFSEIFDGEVYDARICPSKWAGAQVFDGPYHTMIPQQGEMVTEQERLSAKEIFTTPEGDTVVDFGQEIAGYVEIHVQAKAGEAVDLSFGEVMDKNGNFYNENYRSAKCQYHYICREGEQTWHPLLTFFGFRYVRVNAFPSGAECAKPENFTAVVVHSDMKRTGYVSCSDPLLNQLFSNCLWGQKGNFLDVPTDCPQRDERLGWTGDAQVFVKTACLSYDTEKFYTKWLADMAAQQREDGYIGSVIPDILELPFASAAWGDAAVICPWEVYLAYGNKEILEKQFNCMKGWIDYISSVTTVPYLWVGTEHFGDWLGLDAPTGSYKGSSRDDLIASAFYAYSTSLVVKTGHILQKDVQKYEILYEKIVQAFQDTYPVYHTQTECALAVYFKIAKDCQQTADQLADMVRSCGMQLQTGFVGTSYLLYALSDYGYADIAYTLLLRREYPSWLYSVTKGATTIWEHWDGIMENGDFWSSDMNSYNHYAYGAVLSWVYTRAAGIQTMEDAPGYEKARVAPVPDERLDWLEASLDTRHGKISSRWTKQENVWRYEITTPVETEICIGEQRKICPPGNYIFFGERGNAAWEK